MVNENDETLNEPSQEEQDVLKRKLNMVSGVRL